MITLELTEAQFKVLHKHFCDDLRYGASGSFGDGEKLTSKKEVISADCIAAMMNKIANNYDFPQWNYGQATE